MLGAVEAWLTLVLAVNAAAFGAMGFDKWRAARRMDRIPEAHLFALAALSGAPGIWLGRSVFRHKTAKPGFRWRLVLATLANGVWVLAWHLAARR